MPVHLPRRILLNAQESELVSGNPRIRGHRQAVRPTEKAALQLAPGVLGSTCLIAKDR